MDPTDENLLQFQSASFNNAGRGNLARTFINIRLDHDTLGWHFVIFNQIHSLFGNLGNF